MSPFLFYPVFHASNQDYQDRQPLHLCHITASFRSFDLCCATPASNRGLTLVHAESHLLAKSCDSGREPTWHLPAPNAQQATTKSRPSIGGLCSHTARDLPTTMRSDPQEVGAIFIPSSFISALCIDKSIHFNSTFLFSELCDGFLRYFDGTWSLATTSKAQCKLGTKAPVRQSSA